MQAFPLLTVGCIVAIVVSNNGRVIDSNGNAVVTPCTHELAEIGRTATVTAVKCDGKGKVKTVEVYLHCSTTDNKGRFGTIVSQRIDVLNRYIGVLTTKITLPQSHVRVLRCKADYYKVVGAAHRLLDRL